MLSPPLLLVEAEVGEGRGEVSMGVKMGVSRGLDRTDCGLEAAGSSREMVERLRTVGYGRWYTSGEDGTDIPRVETLRVGRVSIGGASFGGDD